LGLPPLARTEHLPDPKRALRDALVSAHGADGRRARQFRPDAARHRVAELIEDGSPLRQLSAFRQLEADTRAALVSLNVPIDPIG
jgi:hypothetical protein